MEKFQWADAPSHTAFPIAKAGYPYIFGSAFVTAVFALLGLVVPALVFLGATACICLFFRDPERLVPTEEKAIVSPADGRIIRARVKESNRFIEGPCLEVSIFMSVANVHVNRVPYSGTVQSVAYQTGRFSVASTDDASENNEHNAIVFDIGENRKMCVVQIAGFVARRILSRLAPGDLAKRGERFGMICFGSRLDCFLPAECTPAVHVGDRVQAGTSIIGYLP